MSLTLGELAGQIKGDLQQGDPDCRIGAVARKMRPLARLPLLFHQIPMQVTHVRQP
jgi:hypothetical protein